MDQIRQSMIKAAQELRALAITTTDLSLKHRLLEQADHLEVASQEDSQDETDFASVRSTMEQPPPVITGASTFMADRAA